MLVIYAEIAYNNPQKNATTRSQWPQGFVPRNADWLFDSQWSSQPKGKLTQYFNDMSFGEFRVLGDHLKRLVTVQEDDIKNLGSHSSVTKAVVEQANLQFRKFKSGDKELTAADFDQWTPKRMGQAWDTSSNQAFDHVMVFLRNWKEVWWSEGHPRSQLPDSLLGYGCDGWISYNTMSFDIIKHEFGHFLLGGNNFHCCGGHDNTRFPSYFMATQCGWGLMGNASSTLKTVNAFERRRLGWKPPDKAMVLSAGSGSNERSTDLNAMVHGGDSTYLLRDFITTGDALRIKLPFIPENELQQWLWLEYHTGASAFDNYENVDCQAPFQAGVYAYIQSAKEATTGSKTFGGHADYIKPLPAMGFYDVTMDVAPGRTPDQCMWGGKSSPSEDHYPVAFKVENPLTGYSDLQHIEFDENGDGTIAPKERFTNHTTLENGKPVNNWAFRGHPRHAFQAGSSISIGTNPSTATHQTLVSTDRLYRPKRRNELNNRAVYLNGLAVSFTQADSGVMKVEVHYDRPILRGNVRWCADSIVLPMLSMIYFHLPEERYSLVVDSGAHLSLARGESPTRMTNAEEIHGELHFNSATKFTLSSGAWVKIDDATVSLEDDSVLEVGALARIILHPKAKLLLSPDAKIILHHSAEIRYTDGTIWQPENPNQVVRLPSTSVLDQLEKGSSDELED